MSARATPRERAPGGVLVGRYRLIERVHDAGAGVRWRARDEQLGRTVMLRVVSDAQGARLHGGFMAEAASAASVVHPHAVRVLDAVDGAPETFLVLEDVHGEPLDSLARSRRLRTAHAIARVVSEIASALDAGHALGVSHGDVSLSNVIVARDGAAKLTEFGAWRSGRAPDTSSASADVRGLSELTCQLLERCADGSAPALDRPLVELVQQLRDGRFESAGALATALARAVRANDVTERIAAPPRVESVLRPPSRRAAGIVLVAVVAVAFLASILGVGAPRAAARASGPAASGSALGLASSAGRSATAQATRTTPNFVGGQAKDAVAQLRALGFRNDVEIVVDPSAAAAAGTVLRQEPPVGAVYRPGDRAKLVVARRYGTD